jgi:pimeloyl-ACP methyl ester carboxylesterase
MGQLPALLAQHFTVFHYDRRGRGDSGDTQPYAVEREIEDIETLINAAGGAAYLYGNSSGSVLALKAAAKLGAAKVTKLVLYQAPFSFGEEAKQEFAKYRKQVDQLLSAQKPGDAVAFFLADMMPPEALEDMRQSPQWAMMETLAPTLAYDNAVLDDGLLPVEDTKAARMPTLVLDTEASLPFQREAADAPAEVLPNVQRRTLEGQNPEIASQAIAPALVEFFTG